MELTAGLYTGLSRLLFRRERKTALLFSTLFKTFRSMLDRNLKIMELMADIGEKLSGEYVFDRQYIITVTEEISELLSLQIADFSELEERDAKELMSSFEKVYHNILAEISGVCSTLEIPFTRFPEELPAPDSQTHLYRELGIENIMMGEIQNILELPVPDRFFVTTKLFSQFMAHNSIASSVEECFADLEYGGARESDRVFKNLKSSILSGEFPSSAVKEISAAAENLIAKSGKKNLTYAVRACEWAKERDCALNPEFRSVLNIPKPEILHSYREIIADLLCTPCRGAECCIKDNFSLSASVSSMVDSEISGFIMTVDPEYPERDTMVICSTFGLGGSLLNSDSRFDRYIVSKDTPHKLLSMNITRKDRMLTLRNEGGTSWINLSHYTCRAPSIKWPRIQEIAESAALIEKYYKRPMKIAWCFDKSGRMFILRANFMNIASRTDDLLLPVETALRNARVLFSGKGLVVQSGIATGRVFVVQNDRDIENFPAGAILVGAQTSPRFSKIIKKAKGILTSVGSSTGHLASVARELRIPAIVNCGKDVKELKTGDEITLDATYNVVYSGAVKELHRYELMEEDPFEESNEYLLLRRLLSHTSHLNLIDTHGRNFTPSGCLTYHDIMRYIYEKATQSLIDLGKTYKYKRNAPVKRLETDIPLGIFIVGIDEKQMSSSGSFIRERELHSIPMRALLKGLRESEMWSTTPLSVDMGSFMSSLTKTFSYSLSAPEQVGMNFALISEEYMNLNLRLGYHYTIIDAIITNKAEDNRISFRFFGGVTDFTRRSMRVRFIGAVLEKFDFIVESHGDLVIGRVKKISKARMVGKIKLLGALVGYTRQLDVRINGEHSLTSCVEDFMSTIREKMRVNGGKYDM